jgi:hypothetical protein
MTSKLIRLPNGPYIRTENIVSIGEPWDIHGEWFYSICYVRADGEKDYYKVTLSPTFVKTEERAQDFIDSFVLRLNNLL